MENKRKSQYSPTEAEKREQLIDCILDELCEENLKGYTTEFLSELVDFICNY